MSEQPTVPADDNAPTDQTLTQQAGNEDALNDAAARTGLGIELCRLSLDLGRQRIRHRRQVGIAIRAAIFIDLALDGRIAGRNWPEALGDADLGDPLADAVHRAVAARRRPIGWRHWFNHVDADRHAATKQLVETGHWSMDGRRIKDNTNGRTLLDQQRIRQAAEQNGEAPGDLREAVLVLLVLASGGVGRPMPRRARKLARAWLPPMLTTSGRGGDAVWAIMLSSLRQIHRSSSVRLLSG